MAIASRGCGKLAERWGIGDPGYSRLRGGVKCSNS